MIFVSTDVENRSWLRLESGKKIILNIDWEKPDVLGLRFENVSRRKM
jgi:hypothetical protein